MSPQVEAVTARLHGTWEKWWTYSLWTGLVLAASVAVALLIVCVLIDALARLDRGPLIAVCAGWGLATMAALLFLVVRLVRYRRSLEATARRVELAFPELESHLINLVQLESGERQSVDPFRQAALIQAAQAASGVPFDQAAQRETRWRRLILCMQTPRDLVEALAVLAGLLLLGGVLAWAVPGWSSAASRMLHPWKFVPAVGSVRIAAVEPGDTQVRVGSPLAVTARVEGASGTTHPAQLFVRGADGIESAQPMLAGSDGAAYTALVAQVLGPLRYRVEIGDSQSPQYQVGVYQKPVVESVEVAYTYPAYLGRGSRTVPQRHADLEGPQMTRADLAIIPSEPIAQGHLEVNGARSIGTVSQDGLLLTATLWLVEPSSYTIHLVTAAGHDDPQPRVNQIRIEPDLPPVVELVEPSADVQTAGGKQVPIVVRASDDHGLGEVRIEWRQGVGEDASQAAPLEVLTDLRDPLASQLRYDLTVDPERFEAGARLQVRGVARDRRDLKLPRGQLDPQETATAWRTIDVIDAAVEAKAALEGLDSARAALFQILQQQIGARVLTGQLTGNADTATATIASIRTRQVGIQAATAALADQIEESDDEAVTLRRVARKLALDDMVQAVKQAEALERLAGGGPMAEPVAALASTQDQIIEVLRRLLDEVRRQTAEELAEMPARRDSVLPSDVEDRLRALKDKLAEFLASQKKVIEATENLAKRPVDDFTAEDEKQLEALAAAQEDWSRFMAEQHSDLSKLPEQDFSNPSMLQEMLAIETELKMAEDALTKKTAEIAVPLEQLGAEMAEEMTTNIEKWLPDTPDRERWSQEEPLTDEMKEAPMAELPGELEDLVGELMEEEEDLFDEMEDMSSSWADSLDKGAGWDAMDGPISNMSARGVTGNRLPNTSEIGGRSGEGRSGKSSGEFVSDTAVGKGGRKTPSRLTPDAVVKGQVKDTSKDPQGGATGGGKESGGGGEGLHGPVPERAARDMGRLADKQAQLRNKAQGLDLKFQVMAYHHTDLSGLIAQMAAVEADLRAGRYSNAVRRREVLIDELDQVRMYVDGEVTIRRDQSVNLPTDVQKEILGSMQEASPPGWDELNRLYFERLGSPASAASPDPEGGE